jgi:hypothetical protein
MIFEYDSQVDEMVVRGGTFDLTGTTAKTNMQFMGFHASDGAVLSVLKGIPLGTKVTTLAGITAVEVDLASFLLTALSDPLFANVPYRPDGYFITNVKLASGSLHLYKKKDQISA